MNLKVLSKETQKRDPVQHFRTDTRHFWQKPEGDELENEGLRKSYPRKERERQKGRGRAAQT